MKAIKFFPKDFIHIINLYINKKHSIIQISKLYKCSQQKIKKILQQNNIHIRGISESIAKIYIPDDRKGEIEKLYKLGKSIRDIAKFYGADRTFIRLFMIRNKIKIRQTSIKRYNFLLEHKDELLQMYKEYGTIQYISDFYNINKTTISNFFDKENIKYKKNNFIETIPLEDRNEIQEMYKNEKSVREISIIYNVSTPTMRTYFKTNNIKFKSLREACIGNGKNISNSDLFRKKQYILPSGKIIKLQGYEPQFLNYIFDNNILNENEIIYKVKPISYISLVDNFKHYYHPDFYIPKYNLIIEIKSTWILKIQGNTVKLKQQAVLNNGFNFLLLLDNNFQTFNKYLHENSKTS